MVGLLLGIVLGHIAHCADAVRARLHFLRLEGEEFEPMFAARPSGAIQGRMAK